MLLLHRAPPAPFLASTGWGSPWKHRLRVGGRQSRWDYRHTCTDHSLLCSWLRDATQNERQALCPPPSVMQSHPHHLPLIV